MNGRRVPVQTRAHVPTVKFSHYRTALDIERKHVNEKNVVRSIKELSFLVQTQKNENERRLI